MAPQTQRGATPLIPRSVIFGNPERTSPQLSPDGTRISYLAPVDGVLNVWVGSVGGDDARPVTHDTDRGIRDYTWAHDGRHLLYLQDVGGDENWRLFKVRPEDGHVTELTPYPDVQVQILAHDKHHPHELLIAMNRRDARFHDVYRLDLRTDAVELIEKNPGDVVSWLADPQLDTPSAGFAVRAATAATPDGGSELRVRSAPGEEWRTIIRWSSDDALTSGALAFDRANGLYLIDSRDVNAARLVRLDLGGGALTVIAEDPRYDVADVVLHPDRRNVQLVAFERARADWVALDPAIVNDLATIKNLDHGDFQILDRTHDDRFWIVFYSKDDGPAPFWLLDREQGAGTFLFHTRPELTHYTLAPMVPIAYVSRDDLRIEGYLTLPADVVTTPSGNDGPPVPGAPLPMVLNVHGGPWHRDTWGYNPEAQWLANRGYACLQVNYRGSTGYGKEFLNAGNKEWGGRMHDDLVDAVRWAVEHRIADPGRVAIYGGSYGGYAALVGATFTPDVFRCAVDIVGPSNLLTFLETIPPYWSTFRAMMHERVGNPETEAELLRARSPLSRVDAIRVPMLIAQGANDPRVKQAESEQIVAAMEAKGIPHEYLLFPDEGHGFAKPENRLRFYAAAEAFLAHHLGGRAEP